MPDFSPELDDKLKALGICPLDLQKALILTREFRIHVVKDNVDPKATRIAILFTELCDREFAEQKLSSLDMIELQQIAQDLFEIAKGNL